MTTQRPLIVPEPWPPNNWPACPDPVRYKNTMERVQKNLERSGGWMEIKANPERIPGELEDDQFIMSEIVSSKMCYEHAMRIVENQEPQDNADQFLFAATLTNHHSIGTAFLTTEGSTSTRTRSTFGIMHRHPEWAGLCPGLAVVKGLEAMIFCRDKHQPDVILAAPMNLLGQDPSKSPRCSEAGNIDRQGINRTLADIFRHHGANPHFIDLCGRSGDRATILANLLSTPDM